MAYPLAGLKVLDFSRVLAGPFASRMLADLGADVVKVEPPEGDVTRYWGKLIGSIPGCFHQNNAGKRNICVDLRASGGKELINAMVEKCDIVIENYRPGVMSRLGIGYEDLKKVNPGLVMLSISGFGHDSPESQRPAFAPVVHAEAGLIRRMSTRSNTVLHDLPLSVGDTNAALHGLIGVMSAIYLRSKTGTGQHIDMAMIDATVATDDNMIFNLEDAVDTGPLPSEIWETPFAPVLLSTDFRLLFKQLTRKHGIEDPSTPEMGLEETIALRRKTVQSFIDGLKTREQFEVAMKKMNIAWGEVRDPACMAEQPSIAARGMIKQIDDRNGGTRPLVQSPYRFSDAESGNRGTVSHRGEDNADVLADWLEMSEKQNEALIDAGVLIFDPDWKHH
ncbi:MAG: CoA transferase [Pseudomonadales bacterium]|nr:CoA transferase [Pseudomonadales bacterium]